MDVACKRVAAYLLERSRAGKHDQHMLGLHCYDVGLVPLPRLVMGSPSTREAGLPANTNFRMLEAAAAVRAGGVPIHIVGGMRHSTQIVQLESLYGLGTASLKCGDLQRKAVACRQVRATGIHEVAIDHWCVFVCQLTLQDPGG